MHISLIVVDDFYTKPMEIRKMALGFDFPEPKRAKNYPGRNSTRMENYHRLDLNISFKKVKKWGERKWIFGLYNSYSRLNPSFISFDNVSPTERNFKQISLFPVIPNISYHFKF